MGSNDYDPVQYMSYPRRTSFSRRAKHGGQQRWWRGQTQQDQDHETMIDEVSFQWKINDWLLYHDVQLLILDIFWKQMWLSMNDYCDCWVRIANPAAGHMNSWDPRSGEADAKLRKPTLDGIAVGINSQSRATIGYVSIMLDIQKTIRVTLDNFWMLIFIWLYMSKSSS